MLFFTCRLNTNVGIPYHTILSLQFIASYYPNNILKLILLNKIKYSRIKLCFYDNLSVFGFLESPQS